MTVKQLRGATKERGVTTLRRDAGPGRRFRLSTLPWPKAAADGSVPLPDTRREVITLGGPPRDCRAPTGRTRSTMPATSTGSVSLPVGPAPVFSGVPRDKPVVTLNESGGGTPVARSDDEATPPVMTAAPMAHGTSGASGGRRVPRIWSSPTGHPSGTLVAADDRTLLRYAWRIAPPTPPPSSTRRVGVPAVRPSRIRAERPRRKRPVDLHRCSRPQTSHHPLPSGAERRSPARAGASGRTRGSCGGGGRALSPMSGRQQPSEDREDREVEAPRADGRWPSPVTKEPVRASVKSGAPVRHGRLGRRPRSRSTTGSDRTERHVSTSGACAQGSPAGQSPHPRCARAAHRAGSAHVLDVPQDPRGVRTVPGAQLPREGARSPRPAAGSTAGRRTAAACPISGRCSGGGGLAGILGGRRSSTDLAPMTRAPDGTMPSLPDVARRRASRGARSLWQRVAERCTLRSGGAGGCACSPIAP